MVLGTRCTNPHQEAGERPVAWWCSVHLWGCCRVLGGVSEVPPLCFCEGCMFQIQMQKQIWMRS